MFKKLPSNSRTLLQEIIDADNPTALLQGKFDKLSSKEDRELRALIRELITEGYINIPKWADNVPWYIEINNSARTYDERETEYERQMAASVSTNTTNNFWGNTSNVQIQQNTSGSSQSMSVDQSIDFDKAVEIFKHVISHCGEFQFPDTEKEHLLDIVTEAMSKAEGKSDSTFIKKALIFLRDMLANTTGSLAASGILHLITQMGI